MEENKSRETTLKKINQQFLALVWIASHQIAQQVQEFGLTQPQFIALSMLAAYQQPCRMHILARATFQTPPNISRIVDQLVKRMLVTRTRNEADRRVTFVQLTPAGCKLVEQIQTQLMNDEFRQFSSLDNNELRVVVDTLQQLLSRQTKCNLPLAGYARH